MLFYTSRCDPFTDVQWLLYLQDQEGCKLYWASGNKVLDTFSTIKSVAYAMLTELCPLQSDWNSQIQE